MRVIRSLGPKTNFYHFILLDIHVSNQMSHAAPTLSIYQLHQFNQDPAMKMYSRDISTPGAGDLAGYPIFVLIAKSTLVWRTYTGEAITMIKSASGGSVGSQLAL